MIYLELFWTFLKIGAFTFGGGYAMLPLIQAEVERHGWMTDAQLVNFVAVSESTPGPFAVNISTYVGMETGGWAGAACATLGVVLPSFLIILVVARCFVRFRSSRLMQGCLGDFRRRHGVLFRRRNPAGRGDARLRRFCGNFPGVSGSRLSEDAPHWGHSAVRPSGHRSGPAGPFLAAGVRLGFSPVRSISYRAKFVPFCWA